MNKRPQQKRLAVSWIGVLLSLALVLWLLRSFNLREAIQPFDSAHYVYLAPAGLLIFAGFGTRALRWRSLFVHSPGPGLISSFVALMVGYLANSILPARAGEVARSYMLSKREGLTISAVLATVMVERVAELVISLLMVSALFLFSPVPVWAQRAGYILALVTLLSLLFLLLLRLTGHRYVTCLLSPLRLLPTSIFSRVRAFGNDFALTIHSLNTKNVVYFLVWSVPVWLSEVLIMVVLARAFNVPLTLAQALFVILMVGIGTAIPSSPGSVGTYEFFFTSALAVLGVTGGMALGFAIAVHAVTFAGANVLGVACLVVSGTSLKRELAIVAEKANAGSFS